MWQLRECPQPLQTSVRGRRFGRRDITLRDIAVRVITEHRRQLLETRMKLGVGKLPNDGVAAQHPWREPVTTQHRVVGFGGVSRKHWNARDSIQLRHTHASQLIASNDINIVTISKRLGHKKPSVTLAIYAHMFHTDDRKAAAAVNAALGERLGSGGNFHFCSSVVLPGRLLRL